MYKIALLADCHTCPDMIGEAFKIIRAEAESDNLPLSKLVFLGDQLGYGPVKKGNESLKRAIYETLHLVRTESKKLAKECIFLRGNHEELISMPKDAYLRYDLSQWSKEAITGIESARKIVSEDDEVLNWLKALPYYYKFEIAGTTVMCCHSNIVTPHEFQYLLFNPPESEDFLSPSDNFDVMRSQKVDFLFIGDTHRLEIFQELGRRRNSKLVRHIDNPSLPFYSFEASRNMIIFNPGSVAGNRHRSPKNTSGSFMILELSKKRKKIFIKRIKRGPRLL